MGCTREVTNEEIQRVKDAVSNAVGSDFSDAVLAAYVFYYGVPGAIRQLKKEAKLRELAYETDSHSQPSPIRQILRQFAASQNVAPANGQTTPANSSGTKYVVSSDISTSHLNVAKSSSDSFKGSDTKSPVESSKGSDTKSSSDSSKGFYTIFRVDSSGESYTVVRTDSVGTIQKDGVQTSNSDQSGKTDFRFVPSDVNSKVASFSSEATNRFYSTNANGMEVRKVYKSSRRTGFKTKYDPAMKDEKTNQWLSLQRGGMEFARVMRNDKDQIFTAAVVRLDSGEERLGFEKGEKYLPSAKSQGYDNFDKSHILSHIWGIEAPQGMAYAHKDVNRSDMRQIEEDVLKEAKKVQSDQVVVVKTISERYEGNLFKDIVYWVEVHNKSTNPDDYYNGKSEPVKTLRAFIRFDNDGSTDYKGLIETESSACKSQ